MYLNSLNEYNFRHGQENPRIIGFELYKPKGFEPRPCFRVQYESDGKIDYVALYTIYDEQWEIVW